MTTLVGERRDSVPAFVADLARHGARTALAGAAGPIGYADLAARVERVARRLGPVRRLVLVEITSTVDGVVGYLGALAGGHAVLLVAPGQAHGSELASRFAPDALVTRVSTDRDDDDVRIDAARPGSAHDLHPELALLMSTSGSTGSPRLVRLSAANLQANAESVATSLGIDETDVAVTTLPLHYCYGLSVLHAHLLRGATVVLTDRSVVDARFWDLVREHRVTSFAGVPYTFELLEKVGFAGRDLPHLRYVTQAGGRMAPDRVRRFAELGRCRGFDLVVMYGQTEATARMAYLPPALAAEHPSAVGVAVPGGSFRLEPIDGTEPGGGVVTWAENGQPVAVGEVVYTGPNVMLGYADSPAELALGRTVDELRTGDLGRFGEAGLLEIVGRLGRTTKVLGLRIDLDRVDAALADAGLTAACAGRDDALVVGVERTSRRRHTANQATTHDAAVTTDAADVTTHAADVTTHDVAVTTHDADVTTHDTAVTTRADVTTHDAAVTTRDAAVTTRAAAAVAARAAGLPAQAVLAVPLSILPRLPSGKPDLVALGDLVDPGPNGLPIAAAPDRRGAEPPAGATATPTPPADEPTLVTLYAEVLGQPDADARSTFVGLGGDSLSYVEMSVQLADRLGRHRRLPDDWPTLTVRDLAGLAAAPPAAEPAPTRPDRRSWWRWQWVETPVLLRALAILAIVASHVGVVQIFGGAHVLLAAAGYSFARFQLAPAPRLVRLRRQVRSIARIVAASVLWIGVATLLTGAYDVTTVLLLNGLVAEPVWSEQWEFWFVEILVYLLVLVAAVLSIPPVDAAERRHPFGVAVAVLAAGLVLRFGVVDLGWTGTRPVLWLFALGWAAARAGAWPGRLLLSAAAAWGAWDYFGDPARDAVVLAGVLALVWVRQVPCPVPLVAVLGPIAAASLYVYLTHWQVVEALADQPGWLTLLACLLVGMGAWRVTGWLGARAGPWLGAAGRRALGRLRDAPRPTAAPTG